MFLASNRNEKKNSFCNFLGNEMEFNIEIMSSTFQKIRTANYFK